jgi:hypothetical protein
MAWMTIADTNDTLVSSLKAFVMMTPEVEEAMRATDRGLYADQPKVIVAYAFSVSTLLSASACASHNMVSPSCQAAKSLKSCRLRTLTCHIQLDGVPRSLPRTCMRVPWLC